MITVNKFNYPHSLQTKVDGNWSTVTVCRDQPNTKGAQTTLPNRTVYIYASLIFVPKNEVIIKPGQDIRVLGENGEERFITTAARFSLDKFFNRLWV